MVDIPLHGEMNPLLLDGQRICFLIQQERI